MKKYYCVVSSFYDNGMVDADIVDSVESEKKPENSYKYGNKADIYCDWFDSKDDAAKFVASSRLGLV